MNRLKKILVSCLICIVAIETCGASGKKRKNGRKDFVKTTNVEKNEIKDKNQYNYNNKMIFLFSETFDDFNMADNEDKENLKKIFDSLLEEELKNEKLGGFYPIECSNKNENYIVTDLDRDLNEIRKKFSVCDFFWLDESNTKNSINFAKLGYNEYSGEVLRKFDEAFNNVKKYIKTVLISTKYELTKKFKEYFETKIKFKNENITMKEFMEQDEKLNNFYEYLKDNLKRLYNDIDLDYGIHFQDIKQGYEYIKNLKLNFEKEIEELLKSDIFKHSDKEKFKKIMRQVVDYFHHNARYKYHEKKVKMHLPNLKNMRKMKEAEIIISVNDINQKFNLSNLKSQVDFLNYSFKVFSFNNVADEKYNRFVELKDSHPSVEINNILTRQDFYLILNTIYKNYYSRINIFKNRKKNMDLLDNNYISYSKPEEFNDNSNEAQTLIIQVAPFFRDKFELYGIKQDILTNKKKNMYFSALSKAFDETIEYLKNLTEEQYEECVRVYNASFVNSKSLKKDYKNFKEFLKNFYKKKNNYNLKMVGDFGKNYHGRVCTSFYKMNFLKNYKNILIDILNKFFNEKLCTKYDDLVEKLELSYDMDVSLKANIFKYLDDIGNIRQIICKINFKNDITEARKKEIEDLLKNRIKELALDSIKHAFERTKIDFEQANDEKSFEELKESVMEFIKLNYGEQIFRVFLEKYYAIKNSDEIPYQDEYSKYFEQDIKEIKNDFKFGGKEAIKLENIKLTKKEDSGSNLFNIEEKYRKIETGLSEDFKYYCRNDKEKINAMKEYLRKKLIDGEYLKQLTYEDIEEIIVKNNSLGVGRQRVTMKNKIDSFLDMIKKYILNKEKNINKTKCVDINSLVNVNLIDKEDIDKLLKIFAMFSEDFDDFCKDYVESEVAQNYLIKKLNINGYLKELDEKDIKKLEKYKQIFDGKHLSKNIKEEIDYFLSFVEHRILEKNRDLKRNNLENKMLELKDLFYEGVDKSDKIYIVQQQSAEIYLRNMLLRNENIEKFNKEDIKKIRIFKKEFDMKYKANGIIEKAYLFKEMIEKYIFKKKAENILSVFYDDLDNFYKNDEKKDDRIKAFKSFVLTKMNSLEDIYFLEEKDIEKFREIKISYKQFTKNNVANADLIVKNIESYLKHINEYENEVETKEGSSNLLSKLEIYKELESVFEEDFNRFYVVDSKELKKIKRYFKDMIRRELNLNGFSKKDIETLKGEKRNVDKLFKLENKDNEDSIYEKIDYFINLLKQTITKINHLKRIEKENEIKEENREDENEIKIKEEGLLNEVEEEEIYKELELMFIEDLNYFYKDKLKIEDVKDCFKNKIIEIGCLKKLCMSDIDELKEINNSFKIFFDYKNKDVEKIINYFADLIVNYLSKINRNEIKDEAKGNEKVNENRNRMNEENKINIINESKNEIRIGSEDENVKKAKVNEKVNENRNKMNEENKINIINENKNEIRIGSEDENVKKAKENKKVNKNRNKMNEKNKIDIINESKNEIRIDRKDENNINVEYNSKFDEIKDAIKTKENNKINRNEVRSGSEDKSVSNNKFNLNFNEKGNENKINKNKYKYEIRIDEEILNSIRKNEIKIDSENKLNSYFNKNKNISEIKKEDLKNETKENEKVNKNRNKMNEDDFFNSELILSYPNNGKYEKYMNRVNVENKNNSRLEFSENRNEIKNETKGNRKVNENRNKMNEENKINIINESKNEIRIGSEDENVKKAKENKKVNKNRNKMNEDDFFNSELILSFSNDEEDKKENKEEKFSDKDFEISDILEDEFFLKYLSDPKKYEKYIDSYLYNFEDNIKDNDSEDSNKFKNLGIERFQDSYIVNTKRKKIKKKKKKGNKANVKKSEQNG